jgi:hypothetical protein
LSSHPTPTISVVEFGPNHELSFHTVVLCAFTIDTLHATRKPAIHNPNNSFLNIFY